MSKQAALGVDIGGTKTLCVLVDKKCKLLKEIKFKTSPDEGSKQFSLGLSQALASLQGSAMQQGYKLAGIGVGCAGSVDVKKGVIKASPNLLCLERFPVKQFLEANFKIPVSIGNDVQVGITAEWKLGAAMGCSNVLGVFFGTGVGGAAIINGQLHLGASGFGGQVGGIVAQPVGGPKAALSHGIVDRIASKAAIASEALVMAVKDWAPYLHDKVGTDLAKVTWGVLWKAIRHGDKRIEEMLRARMNVVGIALSSVVNFLNPEMLVLGGGLVQEMPELVVEEVGRGMHEYLAPEVSKAVKVRPARLGSAAVALGAAMMALENRE